MDAVQFLKLLSLLFDVYHPGCLVLQLSKVHQKCCESGHWYWWWAEFLKRQSGLEILENFHLSHKNMNNLSRHSMMAHSLKVMCSYMYELCLWWILDWTQVIITESEEINNSICSSCRQSTDNNWLYICFRYSGTISSKDYTAMSYTEWVRGRRYEFCIATSTGHFDNCLSHTDVAPWRCKF